MTSRDQDTCIAVLLAEDVAEVCATVARTSESFSKSAVIHTVKQTSAERDRDHELACHEARFGASAEIRTAARLRRLAFEKAVRT